MKSTTLFPLIDFLRHIQRELAFIGQVVKDTDVDTLLADPTKSGAAVHSLLTVGNAFQQVSAECKARHPEFVWQGFAKLRHCLINSYWEVDPELLWEAVSVDVPANKEWIDVIIEQEVSAS